MKASQNPEAAFLAAMTASATHEVRNVLAIIKESAGLVEDMIHVFDKKGTLEKERVYRAVDRIDVQVKRGADLLTNLNRLTHTLDSDLAQVELNHEVEQAVFLSQRFARKKGHRVVAESSAHQAHVTVHPLHLHMAFFSAMECCMEALPDGAAITLGVGLFEGHPMVEFRGTTESGQVVTGPPCGESWDCTQLWTDALGAEIRRAESGFGIRILFSDAAGG